MARSIEGMRRVTVPGDRAEPTPAASTTIYSKQRARVRDIAFASPTNLSDYWDGEPAAGGA